MKLPLLGNIRELWRGVAELGTVRGRQIFYLFALTVFSTVFESVSITLILPVLEFIESGQNAEKLSGNKGIWQAMFAYHRFLGLRVSLVSLMGSVFAVVMVRQVFDYAQSLYAAMLREQTLRGIRCRGFSRFLRADMEFFTKHNTGGLVNALSLDCARAGEALVGLVNTFGFLALASVYFLILILLNPSTTVIAAVLMALIGYAMTALLKRTRAYGGKISSLNRSFMQTLVERFGAIRLIKLTASEDREEARHHGIADTLFAKGMAVSRIQALMNAAIQVMVLAGALVVVYVSSQIYHLSLAKISLFVFVLLRLMPIAQHLLKYAQNISVNAASLDSVRKLIREAEREPDVAGGARRFEALREAVEYRDVGFSYASRDFKVLDGVSVTFPAHKMTAIVGHSGAGKTTLVNLLPRLIRPGSGSIRIDGIDIAEFDPKSLRAGIAFVSQDSFLFDASVADNIRYGAPDASLDEVQAAARRAYVADFVESLPQKYDTVTGERGVRLSGGQKQRLVLARALLRHASVIILDEPTSSLDSESEHYIQKAIGELMSEGRTTLIVIAHRLSTIRSADQIVVMRDGRIVETGLHEQLMMQDKWYSGMFRRQAGGMIG